MRPFELKKTVNKELPEFSGFDQCDAQEFLTYFLNRMSEDLNRHNQDHNEAKEDDEAKQENDQMGMQSGEIGKRLPA